MSYFDALTAAMTWLGSQKDTVFLGQGIVYGGHAMFKTLEGVPMEKRIELPVAEELQLGMSLGMSLTGKTVISIFPRMDFLMCAMNQLVNHADKLEDFTHGQYHAHVIIRVGIGSTSPMHPGPQHCGDYTEALQMMLKRIPVLKLERADQIMDAYQAAYERQGSSLIVEDMNLYATL
mgnify:CR=1 FL=1